MLDNIYNLGKFICDAHLEVGAIAYELGGSPGVVFLFGTEFSVLTFGLYSIFFACTSNSHTVLHPDIAAQVVDHVKLTPEKLKFLTNQVEEEIKMGYLKDIRSKTFEFKADLFSYQTVYKTEDGWAATGKIGTCNYQPQSRGTLYDLLDSLFHFHKINDTVVQIVPSSVDIEAFKHMLMTAGAAEKYVIFSMLMTCTLALSVILGKLGLNSLTTLISTGVMLMSLTGLFIFDKLIVPVFNYYNICPKLMYRYAKYKLTTCYHIYSNFMFNYYRVYGLNDFPTFVELFKTYFYFFSTINTFSVWGDVNLDKKIHIYPTEFQNVAHLAGLKKFQIMVERLMDMHATHLADQRLPAALIAIDVEEARMLGRINAKCTRLYEAGLEHLNNNPEALRILIERGVLTPDRNLSFDNLDIPHGTNIRYEIVGRTDTPTTERIVRHYTSIRDDTFLRSRMHREMAESSRAGLPNQLFTTAREQLTGYVIANYHDFREERINELVPIVNQALGAQVTRLRSLDLLNSNNNNLNNNNNNLNNNNNVNNNAPPAQNNNAENIENNNNAEDNSDTEEFFDAVEDNVENHHDDHNHPNDDNNGHHNAENGRQ